MNTVDRIVFVGLLVSLSILIAAEPVYAQQDSRPVAQMVPDPGPVQVQRNGEGQSVSTHQTIDLYEGDVVSVESDQRALVYFDHPPVHAVNGGESLVIQSAEKSSSAARSNASNLWAAFKTILGRLTGQEVEGPPEPRDGGVRAGDTTMTAYRLPSLVLPARSTALSTQPTITWWSAGQRDGGYRLTVVEGADPVGCWGGSAIWRGEVTDTTWTYPADAPDLSSGSTYRIEVLASNQQVDYACFRIAPDDKRTRFRESLSQLEEDTGLRDPAAKKLLRAGVLAESGYFIDALSTLQDLRQTHPKFPAAREMWNLLLYQATQTAP
jgi:hypothetical protein